ncbi:hypothetical protein M970_060620 [Encephalitozoon cuniculi EcunIII-L]|nr:hypothetical protein M970_060620 [Encephalitozoon cuniculi EcunIII-L]
MRSVAKKTLDSSESSLAQSKEVGEVDEVKGMETNAEKKDEPAMESKGCCKKCSNGDARGCHSERSGNYSEQPEKQEAADGEDSSKKESPREEQTPLLDKEEADEKTEENAKPSSEKKNDAFIPPILGTSMTVANKEIFEDRENGNTVVEGWMWKKRRIFSCFWHRKYFVLTREGILKYYKADGRRHPKGNWNMKDSTEIRHYNLPSEENSHPFRVLVFFPDFSFLLAFDDKNSKDYWVEKLNETIRRLKK